MKLTDTWKIRDLLLKINNPNSEVKICLAILEKEAAIREAQANRGKENRDNGFEIGN